MLKKRPSMGIQGIKVGCLLEGSVYWGYYGIKGLSLCHTINGNQPAGFFWYDTDLRKNLLM